MEYGASENVTLVCDLGCDIIAYGNSTTVLLLITSLSSLSYDTHTGTSFLNNQICSKSITQNKIKVSDSTKFILQSFFITLFLKDPLRLSF